MLAAVLHGGEPVDWWTFEQAAGRVGGPVRSRVAGSRRRFQLHLSLLSPLFAWLMVPVTAMGIAVGGCFIWQCMAVLPWRLALLTMLTWPFWEDVWHGNVMTFVFVSGFLALRLAAGCRRRLIPGSRAPRAAPADAPASVPG